MGATAPSRLLPESRDSFQALAVVQETPLAPYLLCIFAAGFLLEDGNETVQTVDCSVWYIGNRLQILLSSVAVSQMVSPNSRTL